MCEAEPNKYVFISLLGSAFNSFLSPYLGIFE